MLSNQFCYKLTLGKIRLSLGFRLKKSRGIGKALNLSSLRVDGFMTIAPYDPDNNQTARDCFANLRKLEMQCRKSINDFQNLSMGMSGDLNEAIAEVVP